MMQESGQDDNNGDNTFEFVDGSKLLLDPSPSPLHTGPPPPPLASSLPPLHAAAPSAPPAASVPMMLNPAALVGPLPTVPQPAGAPYTFTPRPPLGSVPTASVPSPLSIPTPSSSTALDLPIVDVGISSQERDIPLNVQSPSAAGGGLFGWIRDTVSGNEYLNKMAQKAKNSVDTVITTLDPQMKELIYSGGDIDIVVASDKESKVGSVREAFQSVFGRATVTSIAAITPVALAPQPVGFTSGIRAAQQRISSLRNEGRVHPQQPVVSVEGFLAELTPDRWYDLSVLLLDDPAIGSQPVYTFTQPTPVPAFVISDLQNRTPGDYPLRWSGFSITVGEIAGPALGVPHTEWQKALSGHSRREMLKNAAITLAHMYQSYQRQRPLW